MSRILFQINYDIQPATRDEYLTTIRELTGYIKENTNHEYLVVEDKNKPNNFTEIYICRDENEFDGLEDEMDDTIYGLTTRIASRFVAGGKTKYSTFYEV
jgi:hypothetical protein